MKFNTSNFYGSLSVEPELFFEIQEFIRTKGRGYTPEEVLDFRVRIRYALCLNQDNKGETFPPLAEVYETLKKEIIFKTIGGNNPNIGRYIEQFHTYSHENFFIDHIYYHIFEDEREKMPKWAGEFNSTLNIKLKKSDRKKYFKKALDEIVERATKEASEPQQLIDSDDTERAIDVDRQRFDNKPDDLGNMELKLIDIGYIRVGEGCTHTSQLFYSESHKKYIYQHEVDYREFEKILEKKVRMFERYESDTKKVKKEISDRLKDRDISLKAYDKLIKDEVDNLISSYGNGNGFLHGYIQDDGIFIHPNKEILEYALQEEKDNYPLFQDYKTSIVVDCKEDLESFQDLYNYLETVDVSNPDNLAICKCRDMLKLTMLNISLISYKRESKLISYKETIDWLRYKTIFTYYYFGYLESQKKYIIVIEKLNEDLRSSVDNKYPIIYTFSCEIELETLQSAIEYLSTSSRKIDKSEKIVVENIISAVLSDKLWKAKELSYKDIKHSNNIYNPDESDEPENKWGWIWIWMYPVEDSGVVVNG